MENQHKTGNQIAFTGSTWVVMELCSRGSDTQRNGIHSDEHESLHTRVRKAIAKLGVDNTTVTRLRGHGKGVEIITTLKF